MLPFLLFFSTLKGFVILKGVEKESCMLLIKPVSYSNNHSKAEVKNLCFFHTSWWSVSTLFGAHFFFLHTRWWSPNNRLFYYFKPAADKKGFLLNPSSLYNC